MTALLEGGEWSAAHPCRTLPSEKNRHSFYRRLGGAQGRSGQAENLVHTAIFFWKIYCAFNHVHRNLTSLLSRVLVVRFPYHVIWHSHLHSLIPAVWGVPFPTPCTILTKVCSFLGFSPRERALSRVSIDSFLPAVSGWPPGMTSISRGARSQYSRAVIDVFDAAFGI